ncbi:hypothetical protein DRQ05_06240 [bacterium]|nr:MAG: hypothetical protein DRQ05_06240 [bacterium]
MKEKDELLHKRVIKRLEKITRKLKIDTFHNIYEQRMCPREIEDQITEIAKQYLVPEEIANISLFEVEKLVVLFEKCRRIHFFRKKNKYLLEEAISNLKKIKQGNI